MIAGAVGIAAAALLGVVALVETGTVAAVAENLAASLAAEAQRLAKDLPHAAVAGAALLLLAVALPIGGFELRHIARVRRARVRARQIARLAPLAHHLGVSPLALGRVTVETLHALSPGAFECACASLLALQGYRDVEHTGGPGDLAADVTCRDHRGHRVVAQCKRFAASHHVGSGEIQKFLGMIVVHHQARTGLFLTTSSYTPAAVELAHAHADRVRLFDGPQVVAMIRAHAVC